MTRQRHRVTLLMLSWNVILLSGCNMWNSYSHPDYDSSRADRICHPYGNCTQGEWVPKNEAESEMDAAEAQLQCAELINESHGNSWWKNSVTHGLEIGECMEKKGFVLRQF
jgi:hypothetical protein